MILLGLVSMGIFLGMPYLVDNSEPTPHLPPAFFCSAKVARAFVCKS